MTDASNPAEPPYRLHRSSLFVPATSERFFAKGAASQADGIILDLEDAVSPDRKDAARGAAVAALNEIDWDAKIMTVRVNGVESGLTYKDVTALAENCPRLDMIKLPMVNTLEDVRFVSTLLEQIERGLGRARPILIECIIETPLGMEHIGEIARAGGRLEGLSFGAGDYAAAMKMPNRSVGKPDPDYAIYAPGEGGGGQGEAVRHLLDPWHFAMARLANACRAHGLRPQDSAYADFKDAEGYRAACLRAAVLGFEGKSCIHPSQIAIANEVFSPSAEQVAWARELMAAMTASLESGQGAVAMGGEMVDLANIKMAENTLAKQAAIEAGEREKS